MDYLFIDCVAVLILSYVMTLSRPVDILSTERPTSSLLGPSVVASVVGMHAINVAFMVGGLMMMKADDDYVEWPAKLAGAASWWTLGDNWETTVIFTIVSLQFVSSALIFSFGSYFRKPVWNNIPLLLSCVAMYVFCALLVLLPEDGLTEVFHFASNNYNAKTTNNPVWKDHQEPCTKACKDAGLIARLGSVPDCDIPLQPGVCGNPASSEGMTFSFRVKLLIMTICGNILAAAWEFFVVNGPVRTHFQDKAKSSGERIHFPHM